MNKLFFGLIFSFAVFMLGASQVYAAVTVQENLVIPDTQQISVVSFRVLVDYDAYDVPLVPKNDSERVIVPNAILTLKEAYAKSLGSAISWASDAKLVGIRSIGSITLDGKSSMWQVAFGSLSKKKGYEVIVQGDSIVSQREVAWVGSGDYGYNVPMNWYDAADALVSISSSPRFKDATVSSVTFYYDMDEKNWGYVLATSYGTNSMWVRGPLVNDSNEYWSAVRNIPNSWNLRKTYGTLNKPADDVIKTVPNDWAIKVTSMTDASGANVDLDGYRWYQVQDATDGATGWMAGKSLSTGEVYLDYDSSAQADLEQKASAMLTTQAARVPVILSAVDTYQTQSNSSNSLYGGGGGLNGNDNFQTFIQGSAFPKELVLAIASVESGSVGFDNEICSGARDGGIGIMQITSSGFKGLGSALRNNPKLNDCLASSGWVGSLSKYYSNASQALYANIKDGYRVLQEKYRPKCPAADRVISGLTFTCQDVGKILTVWGYNGKVLAGNYLRLVSNALRDLPSYVGITYPNTDQLVEKLALANNNRIEFQKFSPVEIQVIDSAGRTTGFDGTSDIKGDIPFSTYDQSTGRGVLFFPDAENQYKFRVIGTGDGTYDFEVDSVVGDTTKTFRADNIPVTVGAVHEFTIDEAALERGERGVTVRVDPNGDGIFDYTTTGGREIHDIDLPQITTAPLANQYVINSSVSLGFSATDQTSGIGLVTGTLNGTTVTSGQQIVLSTAGLNTLVVTAIDNAGNSNIATSTFSVVYTASAFLSPIKTDGNGVYNLGRTLPVKFILSDYAGNSVSTAVAHLVIAKVSDGVVGTDEIPLSTSAVDSGDNIFRLSSLGTYIYNLSTDTMTVGTWQIKAILDSGQIISAIISIR